MQMNWKDAIEGVNVVYPEGTYRVLVKSWKPTTSKNKGTAGIVWSVGIMEPETFKNKTIFCTTWLVEAALWKLARLVNACGIDVSKMGSMDVGSKEMGAVLNMCIQKTTYWRLGVRTLDNGSEQNEVLDFQPDAEQAITEEASEDNLPEFLK